MRPILVLAVFFKLAMAWQTYTNLAHDLVTVQADCLDDLCDQVDLTITSASSPTLTLQLLRNVELYGDNFKQQVDTEPPTRPFLGRSMQDVNCFYLNRDPGTDFAAIGLCDGKVEGSFLSNSQVYRISFDRGTGQQIMYQEQEESRSRQMQDRTLKDDLVLVVEDIIARHHLQSSIVEPVPFRQGEEPPHKYVEILIITDRQFFQKNASSNRQELTRFVGDYVNRMNAGLRLINFTGVLAGHLSWEKEDELSEKSSIVDQVTSLVDLSVNSLAQRFQFDAIQLISGQPYPLSIGMAGIAVADAMCLVREASVSVVHAETRFTGLSQFYIAGLHEFTHLFGTFDEYYNANDVDKRPPPPRNGFACVGGCVDHPMGDFCVMRWLVDRRTGIFWSECTKQTLLRREAEGRFRCTYNRPVNASVVTICGNGLKETGEECDCPRGDANCARCCNMSNCTFVSGATCAGLCCQNCNTISPSGTVCRSSSHPCDFEDTCDGQSEFCTDRIQPDRTDCNGSTASLHWCLRGSCEFACFADCGGALMNQNQGSCLRAPDRASGTRCECTFPFYGDFCTIEGSGKFAKTIGITSAVILVMLSVAAIATIIVQSEPESEPESDQVSSDSTFVEPEKPVAASESKEVLINQS